MRQNKPQPPNNSTIDRIKENIQTPVKKTKKYDGNTEKTISTGSTLLDLEISGGRVKGGGIPGGILGELYGPNAGGKTVLMSEIAGGVQRQNGRVKFFDSEARLNSTFASIFDFSVDDCEFGIPEQVKDVFGPIYNWLPDGPKCIGEYNARTKKCKDCPINKECKVFEIATKPIHGIFIDSLAQLSGELEAGENIDARGSARAKEFSQWMRKLAPMITKNNWLIIGSNQVRDNQNAANKYSPKHVTPGGNAIPHAASLRLSIYPSSPLIQEKTISGKKIKYEYGMRSMVKVIKSTVWKPHRSTKIDIVYDYGIDDISPNLQYIKNFTKDTVYWTGDNSLADAVAVVEADGLELELKEVVIDLWEEIQEKFRIKRKPKRR